MRCGAKSMLLDQQSHDRSKAKRTDFMASACREDLSECVLLALDWYTHMRPIDREAQQLAN